MIYFIGTMVIYMLWSFKKPIRLEKHIIYFHSMNAANKFIKKHSDEIHFGPYFNATTNFWSVETWLEPR